MPTTMKTVRPEAALLQALRDRDAAREGRMSAIKERDAYRAILLKLAKSDGIRCEKCRGTERDVGNGMDHLSDLEVDLALLNDWDSIDASFPDDCPDAETACFDGYALMLPEDS